MSTNYCMRKMPFPSLSELSETLKGVSAPFHVVWTSTGSRWQPRGDVIVLDSSFNPPSKAHQNLAVSALKQFGASDLLLLFATKNADKALGETPSVAHKLAMMHRMALDVQSEVARPVAIALVNEPYFAPKAAAIRKQVDCPLKFIIGWECVAAGAILSG
jgi:nicotinamide-nucleotide adenylyltransferase